MTCLKNLLYKDSNGRRYGDFDFRRGPQAPQSIYLGGPFVVKSIQTSSRLKRRMVSETLAVGNFSALGWTSGP